MKMFQKCTAIVLVVSMTLVLYACGGEGSDAPGSDIDMESWSETPDAESAEPETSGLQEATAPDRGGIQKKTADQLLSSDSEETARLLDVTFYAGKDEAETAARDRLIASHDSDAAGSDGYNPESWCYALITAVRDDTTVMISRGYDRITQGDDYSGFFRNFTECYEIMDAGDKLVMQVNVEWYPVFMIDVFDDEYKTSIPLGWDIYLSRDEKGIPAPLTVIGQKIIHPIALYRERHYINDEDSLAHYPKYTYDSVIELIYADKDHPELAKRLEAMNAETDDEYEEGLGMLGLESADEYASSAHDGSEYYYKNLRSSICRADDTVLSFVRYYDADLVSIRYSSALGLNLDTSTGEDVRLDAVLTDVNSLPDAVYEQCVNLGFDEDASTSYRDVARQYIEDGDYISSSYFSWNICYEGLWLHFNDSVPQEILDSTSGRNSVFLPFIYYPELFADKYTNVPDDYCYDIEAHPVFGDYYALNLNKDGEYLDFALRAHTPPDSYSGEYIYQFSIEMGSDKDTLYEGIFCMDYDAFVVHSASDIDYLYINQTGGNDNSECTVYQLSRELFYEGTTIGTVNDLYVYGDWNDHSNGINGRIMTDPTHFLMAHRDNRLGYDIICAYHELGRSGEPMKSDNYWTYAFDGDWEIYPLKDFKVSAVNEDCEITGETTLYADTLIRPYRTDSFSWIDFIDQKGKLYRIDTEKTVENPSAFISVDGETAEELFGGILYLYYYLTEDGL